MNSSPRMAAAARNTALFHIGSKPRSTPEKIKPGNAAPNRSDVTVGCISVNTAGEDAPLCDTAIPSVGGRAVVIVCDPVSDNAAGS